MACETGLYVVYMETSVIEWGAWGDNNLFIFIMHFSETYTASHWKYNGRVLAWNYTNKNNVISMIFYEAFFFIKNRKYKDQTLFIGSVVLSA